MNKLEKLANILFLFFAAISLGLATVSCSDDENNNIGLKFKSTEVESVFNSDNPYDTYGEEIIKLFDKFELLLTDSIDEDEYYIKVDSLIKNNSISYPKYSEEIILRLDSIKFSSIFDNFLDDLNHYGLLKASKIAENHIKKYFTDIDTQRMSLCIISELKYCLYVSNIINYAPDREQRVDNCMYNKMYDIKHGNWIDKVVFIAGLPETAIAYIASCEYDAVFNPDKKECQQKKPFPEDIKK